MLSLMEFAGRNSTHTLTLGFYGGWIARSSHLLADKLDRLASRNGPCLCTFGRTTAAKDGNSFHNTEECIYQQRTDC